MANKIRKGDTVVILAGKDKGGQGPVTMVMPAHVLVEGMNVKTKAVKANPNKGIEGGFVKQPAKIAISNVAVVNPNTGKADRIGFKISEDGTKQRYFKSDDSVLSD